MPSAASVRCPPDLHCEEMKNPWVFLDISIDGGPPERLEIELFADVVPKTAENFRALCTGEKGIGKNTGKPLHYKGTVFYRVCSNLYAHGGDFSNQNGTGGESIYGGYFEDENFELTHAQSGVLSMANHGKNSNGSNFFLIFNPAHFFDRFYVVFGKVIRGMETVEKINQVGTSSVFGKPTCVVKITDCGEIPEHEKDYVNASVRKRTKKTEKRAKSSNSVSDFYFSKMDYPPTTSDLEFYFPPLVKIPQDMNKMVREYYKAIFRRVRISGSRAKYVSEFYYSKRKYWLSESSWLSDSDDSEFHSSQISDDKKNNVMESDKGEKIITGKRVISSDDGRVKKKQRGSGKRKSKSFNSDTECYYYKRKYSCYSSAKRKKYVSPESPRSVSWFYSSE